MFHLRFNISRFSLRSLEPSRSYVVDLFSEPMMMVLPAAVHCRYT